MEKFLDQKIQKQLEDLFVQLLNPVAIVLFINETNCEYCQETRQLLQEVADLSDKIMLQVHNLETEGALAQSYRIDKAPGFIIAGFENEKIKNYNICYYGIPAGSEFTSLVRDILMVSSRDSGLSEATREFLRSLTKPVHLEVFVTPT